jgi:hypothetical protein
MLRWPVLLGAVTYVGTTPFTVGATVIKYDKVFGRGSLRRASPESPSQQMMLALGSMAACFQEAFLGQHNTKPFI